MPNRDLGDKVSGSDRSRVEGLVQNLREAINQDNFDQIKSLTNELQQALMQVGSAVYAQAASPTNGAQPSDGGSEDVIDADFVENK